VATSPCAPSSGRAPREVPRPPTEATVTLRGDKVPGTNSRNSGVQATVMKEAEPMQDSATLGRRIPRHDRSARRVRGGRPLRGGQFLATFVHSGVTSQSAQQHLRKRGHGAGNGTSSFRHESQIRWIRLSMPASIPHCSTDVARRQNMIGSEKCSQQLTKVHSSSRRNCCERQSPP